MTLNQGFSAQNIKMDVERRSKYKAVEPDNISVVVFKYFGRECLKLYFEVILL